MNSDFSILSKLSLLLTQLVNPQKSACKLLRTLRLCNICSIIQTFYGQNNSQKSSSIFFLKLLHVLHNIRYRNSRIYYCHHTSPNVFLASTECSKNGKKVSIRLRDTKRLGLVFDGFSSFCDYRNELRMTFITRNS